MIEKDLPSTGLSRRTIPGNSTNHGDAASLFSRRALLLGRKMPHMRRYAAPVPPGKWQVMGVRVPQYGERIALMRMRNPTDFDTSLQTTVTLQWDLPLQ